ncbi:MAG TPA: diaminopimelate decarboxylase, partial [Aquificae bacterium]|nr:diaminopimelate decarboxylase [Aquificota bacterium]
MKKMINLKDFLPSLNIKDRKIFVENFDLEILKKETPIFVYSKEAIDYFINKVKNAFKDYDTKIFYAVKANSNINILKIYKENDIGFDTVSKGELFRVLKVEKDLENTIFSGVGKREDEIEYALKNNILAINVESFS